MNFICTIFLLLSGCSAYATIYTFENSGSYSDETNWDTYPGETIDEGDTILIEANSIYNVNLLMWGGLLLFSDEVNHASINDLEINNSAIVEFQGSGIILDISGSITDFTYNGFVVNCWFFMEIYNYGSGFIAGTASLDGLCGDILYFNYGEEEAFILGLNNTQVYNCGTLNVYSDVVYVSCILDLSDGTITGYDQNELIQYSQGEINQSCSNCTSYITNASLVKIDKGTIKGTVIID